jgi:phenylalanyl-tRNA synthetase beta chain
MKVPLNWLKKYLPLIQNVEEISATLTLIGLEVETIEGNNYPFTGVVIAKIEAVSSHPNADRLKIARIFDGTDYYEVVCGDPSIQSGMIVAFAKIGAVLGLNSESPFKIKKSKIRNIESEGMLCSIDELGLQEEKAPTILQLSEDAPLGKDLQEFLYNPIFDITLTPNLGRCRSIFAIARELSAALKIPCTPPKIVKIKTAGTKTADLFQLTNRVPELCPVYTARLIKGVRVAPSPTWLSCLLKDAGVKPINNIVDITNYVMLEFGQPMHAFDVAKLPTKQIVIDIVKKPTSITALDRKTYELPLGTILIQDDHLPIAIGGIMGGLDSAISDTTTDILLEAAIFSSSLIRQKSRELSLRSESSSRFENEVDHGGIERAMDRAVELILQIAGGTAAPDLLVSGPLTPSPRFVAARVSNINRLLGTQITLNEATALLELLEFEVLSDKEDLLHLKPPSYRNDIHLEVDIIEEVGRLYGYNNIERKAPLLHVSNAPNNPFFLLERKLKKKLVAEGLQEFITCNLIGPELCRIELENGFIKSECINVLKPSSQEQSILRSSMLPGHLLCLKNNRNVKNEDIAAFEIGRIHFKHEEQLEEKLALSITLSGKNKPYHFQDKPRKINFYDIKGVLENLFTSLTLSEYSFKPSTFKGFHPFQQAAIYIKDQQIGVIGQIHPETLEHIDIEEEVFFAEIELSALIPYIKNQIIQKPLPQFPSSERDLTLTIAKNQSLSILLNSIMPLKQGTLKEIQLIDIYENPSIGEDKKNVTFRFTYRDDNATLDYETVEKLHKEVQDNLRVD